MRDKLIKLVDRHYKNASFLGDDRQYREIEHETLYGDSPTTSEIIGKPSSPNQRGGTNREAGGAPGMVRVNDPSSEIETDPDARVTGQSGVTKLAEAGIRALTDEL